MKIQYLTWLNERVGTHEENIDIPNTVSNINDLMNFLGTLDDKYQSLFQNRHTIYTAVNNEIQSPEFIIHNTDQISFFSAVVGG